MWRTIQQTIIGSKRRAVVAVQVAVMGTVIIGFAALTVDVSVMYNARGELQRTADAAALAAASRLAAFDEGDPLQLAREAALTYTQENPILGRQVTLASTDVVFGRAVYNPGAGAYEFTPTEVNPDAVRVTVRQTADSPNGALPLYFAGIFGRHETDVWAEAIALLVPRDIAVVADLSGSHTDDSELKNYGLTTINLHGVWDGFPGGIDDAEGSLWAGDEFPLDEYGYSPQMAGPAWGLFKQLGYGTIDVDASYNPAADPGLIYLPYNVAWTNPMLQAALAAQGYSSAEVTALMARTYDASGYYQYRTAAALGLAWWNSGKPGGLWEQMGVAPGNTDNIVTGSETMWVEQFGDRSLTASRDIWKDYINSYMRSTSTTLYSANHAFRYRLGVKTFINYLMEQRTAHSQTPELANTPEQPMQAVKDAVVHLVTTVDGLDSEDQLSLEIYGTTARHEVDLTMDYYQISNRLTAMQAGHYDSWTNMGGGILRGIQELDSARANPIARKVMILLTDGYANVPCETCSGGDYEGGMAYALTMAQEAADQGIQIFAV
ncbi:MAG: VWA domain-containing protein, partial [Planctomycetota bacterium]